MAKRTADMIQSELERSRELSKNRKRKQRSLMTPEQKEEAKTRDREAQRRSRQRKGEFTGAKKSRGYKTTSLPPPDSAGWVAVDAALKCIQDTNQLASLDPSPSMNEHRAADAGECIPPINPELEFEPSGCLEDRPRNSPLPPTIPSSPLTDLSEFTVDEFDPSDNPRLDFVTDVLGVQVCVNAEQIEWTSGQHSILPYLEVENDDGKVENLLMHDQQYVQGLARLPESQPSSSLVLFLDRHMKKFDLVNAARDGLSRNKAVVVRGFLDVDGFEFTMAGLVEEFNTLPNRPMEVHDMGKRVHDFSDPFVHTTVSRFVRDIENPGVVRVALNFPLPQLAIPPPFEKLDDGLCLGWAQTQGLVPVDNQLLPGDIWTVGSWAIAHHAGIVTYPHHDAEGAGTYAIPLSGIKNWVLFAIKDQQITRQRLPRFLANLSHPDSRLDEFLAQVDAETIHLYPGDLIIMPPGQMHSVYTPVASLCRGGNFFNLDTMHLMELSRFVDTTKAKYVTNQAHMGTLETLCRIVLTLPFLSRARKLYKRSLISLCGMVVHHTKYNARGGFKQRCESIDQATDIAQAVLAYFGLNTFQLYTNFISKPDADMFDRGEVVDSDVYDLFKDLRIKITTTQ
ncbi:hypothetical protein OG21DRAFT_1500591 [Imleria badia]|nr:hypothetical protein OG21DRAFT_1500591 [Imleria badia]